MSQVRRSILAAVAALAFAIPASAAEIDTRVLQQLNEIGMAYQIDGDNDFAIVIEFNDGRSQMLFVRSEVYTSRGMGMRDIWSHAFVPGPGEQIPADLQTRLLEENFNRVMGGWVRTEDRIAYMAKIPEDAPADVLRAAILEVAELADELEKELVGTDEL